MWPFKKKTFFSEEEKERIVQAIRQAERMTSGEVRVFVESRCRFVDPMDRATEVFDKLEMQKTRQHNGVVLYVAMEDRQFAIYGDTGIHQKVGMDFWKQQAQNLKGFFSKGEFVVGIAQCVKEIGASLETYFPYESDDENELPDDIVFGK